MRFKTWRTWTAGELRQLEELRIRAETVDRIAAELERTAGSVRNRLTAERIEAPLRLARWLPILSRPHTIAGAAALMGVTKWAVKQAKRRLRRLGFDVPPAAASIDQGGDLAGDEAAVDRDGHRQGEQQGRAGEQGDG